MRSSLPYRLAVASAFALMPFGALADLTAGEVWADLQSYAASSGQTIVAESETADGGVLTLTNVTSTFEMPTGSAKTLIPRLQLDETRGGEVEITLSPVITVTSNVVSPDGPVSEMTSEISHEGLELVASGEVGHVSYRGSAALVAIVARQVMEGEGAVDMTTELTLTDMAGQYETVANGAGSDVTYDATAANLAVSTRGAAKGEGATNFEVTGTTTNIAFSGGGSLAKPVDGTGLSALIDAGSSFEGGYTLGKSDYTFSFQDGDTGVGGTVTSESAQVDVAFAPEGIRYNGAGKSIALRVAGPSIPLPPVNVGIADYGFGLTLPIAASENPQDFGLLLRLAGVTVDEAIWRMFDPEATIPRDPATISLALSGKGNWLVDIFDPEAAAVAEQYGDTPGELESLNLTDLQLSIGGADLTGLGRFTFDNDDTTTWKGLPAPDGSVNVRLSGGYGLLDKLVALGMVPQDKALGLRMMLGAFTAPGAEPDTMTSEIVVMPDGSVTANGTKIK